jgi:hypothetical protein
MTEEGLRNAEQLRIAVEKCIEHDIPPELAGRLVPAAYGFGRPNQADWLCELLMVRSKGAVAAHSSVIGWLITVMIERCQRESIHPSAALARLVRAYTGADRFAANEIRAAGAFNRAAWFLAIHPKASLAKLASVAGVSPEAVRQWKKRDELEKFAAFIRRKIAPLGRKLLKEFAESLLVTTGAVNQDFA